MDRSGHHSVRDGGRSWSKLRWVGVYKYGNGYETSEMRCQGIKVVRGSHF